MFSISIFGLRLRRVSTSSSAMAMPSAVSALPTNGHLAPCGPGIRRLLHNGAGSIGNQYIARSHQLTGFIRRHGVRRALHQPDRLALR